MTQLAESKIQLWQRPEWPHFQWDSSALLDSLVRVRHQQGRLLALTSATKFTEKSKLTTELLCEWAGVSVRELDSQMAVPAGRLADELSKFLGWWNETPVGLDGIIRAGIAYFWFLTILPFDHGNAFVAKSLVNLALAQDEKIQLRPYNLDQIFLKNKTQIETIIAKCQEKNGDITFWLNWFFEKLFLAINAGLDVRKKTADLNLNSRQRKILAYLSSIPGEFVAITNRECVELCQTSRESIKRDLAQMVAWDLLARTDAAGRSVCYLLKN